MTSTLNYCYHCFRVGRYYYNHATAVVADTSELYTYILYYIILHSGDELINNTALLQVLWSKDQHSEREAGIRRTSGCFVCLEKYETTFCLFIIYINHELREKNYYNYPTVLNTKKSQNI